MSAAPHCTQHQYTQGWHSDETRFGTNWWRVSKCPAMEMGTSRSSSWPCVSRRGACTARAQPAYNDATLHIGALTFGQWVRRMPWPRSLPLPLMLGGALQQQPGGTQGAASGVVRRQGALRGRLLSCHVFQQNHSHVQDGQVGGAMPPTSFLPSTRLYPTNKRWQRATRKPKFAGLRHCTNRLLDARRLQQTSTGSAPAERKNTYFLPERASTCSEL